MSEGWIDWLNTLGRIMVVFGVMGLIAMFLIGIDILSYGGYTKWKAERENESYTQQSGRVDGG